MLRIDLMGCRLQRILDLGRVDRSAARQQARKQGWAGKRAVNAPTIDLKAKKFAAKITIHNTCTQQMRSEPQISREPATNNEAVRQTLLDRGIRPESLPPAEDVKSAPEYLRANVSAALPAK